MRRSQSLRVRLSTAALVSALAALLMVAVGPSFAEKPEDAGTPQGVAQGHDDNDSDEAGDEAASESSDAEESDVEENSTVAQASSKGNSSKPDDGPPGQTTPKGGDTDLVGGGAGNSENSTQDRPDDASNGPGTGQEPADGCTNKHQGADPQQGGANKNPGPYDNTCDGRPSENGNGGGNATGRPCMGCVGNADDKNPKGQLPNGRDRNAGYECDRNNGIGKGNPAHTDCQGEPPECPEGDEDCEPPECPEGDEDCEPPEECPPGHVKNGKCGEEPKKITVCHYTGSGKYVVITISINGATHGHENHENDIIGVSPDTNPEDCAEVEAESLEVCHRTSSGAYVPLTIDSEDLEDHLAHGDIYPMPRSCGEDVDDERLCPEDSDRPGADIPAGQDMEDFCYDEVDSDRLCPAGTDLEGRPMPSDGNCDLPEDDLVCPANSDFPGMPVPGRTMASCFLDTVLGDREEREPDVEGKVLGARPPAKVRGGALPFTGTSVLAFLVLALQLIAAGTLILRGKRS